MIRVASPRCDTVAREGLSAAAGALCREELHSEEKDAYRAHRKCQCGRKEQRVIPIDPRHRNTTARDSIDLLIWIKAEGERSRGSDAILHEVQQQPLGL